MKVDIVVNSMIQQIDRNLQTQVMPALSFRPGEILRGRVMLTDGDKLQIRLDNGALLNALPAGDVLLMQGSTVTLRVNGRMDGNFVMQLLEQELSGELAAGLTGAKELEKLGLQDTPQGRAVVQSMQRLNLPVSGDTARRAMEILRQYPDLETDKAVFLAANGMQASREQVEALNRSIDGKATVGGELLKLAGLLNAQNPETQEIIVTPGGVAPEAEPGWNPPAQAEGAAAPSSAMLFEHVVPDGESETPLSTSQLPVSTAQTPAGGNPSVIKTPETQTAMPGITEQEGMLRLQSLVLVALGPDAAERYAGMVAALGQSKMTAWVAALALDGPFMDARQLDAQLQVLKDSLPQGIARDARTFAEKLVAGIGKYISRNNPEALIPRQPLPEGGAQRLVREIMEMFVRVERDADGDAGAQLAKAVGAQKEGLSHLAAEVSRLGTAGPEAARQLDAVTGQAKLLNNVSQYVCQQIPIQLNGRNCTAEIYVINREGRRGKKIDPENAHVLIALDTEHMGRVEALASVSRKALRLRFGVERPGLMGHISGYTAELTQAMKEIGYRLSDIRTQVIPAPTNPMTAGQSAEPAANGLLDVKV